jgi:hypothetical protein
MISLTMAPSFLATIAVQLFAFQVAIMAVAIVVVIGPSHSL